MRKQGLSQWLFRPGGGSAPPATILIRLAVGGVFFASGLIKFLYANQGAGRFAKLRIPAPELTAKFVGVVEIAAGLLLVVGLATRLAAIPLVMDMLVAIGASKLPMLFDPGLEPVAAAPQGRALGVRLPGTVGFHHAPRLPVPVRRGGRGLVARLLAGCFGAEIEPGR
jgi:uncharacterized membrane protein YphA (DoxX/SURF4 family)